MESISLPPKQNKHRKLGGARFLVRNAISDAGLLCAAVKSRQADLSNISYLADRITRAFWIAFIATLDAELGDLFSIAQDSQTAINQTISETVPSRWIDEIEEAILADYLNLIEKAEPLR